MLGLFSHANKSEFCSKGHRNNYKILSKVLARSALRFREYFDCSMKYRQNGVRLAGRRETRMEAVVLVPGVIMSLD